jgi:hypothetical protein
MHRRRGGGALKRAPYDEARSTDLEPARLAAFSAVCARLLGMAPAALYDRAMAQDSDVGPCGMSSRGGGALS